MRVFVSIFILFVAGCATESVPLHYEVSSLASSQSHSVLPKGSKIYLIESIDGELMRSETPFVGWDFDSDGRFDMLEIYDRENDRKSHAFDFDGDGQIDLVKKVSNNSF